MTRRAISMRHLLILLISAVPLALGCAQQDPPVAPTFSPSRPPPTPPAPPPPAVTAPAFPVLTRPGEIYNAPDSLYDFWSPYHGGRVASRYVLYEDGFFGLQFSSPKVGLMEYHGRYVRTDSLIAFAFLTAQGPPSATGTLRGDSLSIKYTPSIWDDFVDGVYLHQPAPPPPPPPTQPPPPNAPDQIHLADANGVPLRWLTTGSRPAWSPDGKRIAFYRDTNVYVINADGSDEVRLSQGASPLWSPNGEQIVFVNAQGISVMHADGTGVRTLLRHGVLNVAYAGEVGMDKPAWSPDGSRIAFEHLGDFEILPSQIYVMNADGSKPFRLTNTPGDPRRFAESDPAWSPDGLSVVFWSYGYGITVSALSDRIPHALYSNFPTVAYGAKPTWSPDGSTIAFNSGRHLPSGRAVMTMRAGGGDVKVLISDAYDAAWSPDGQRIAFVSTAR